MISRAAVVVVVVVVVGVWLVIMMMMARTRIFDRGENMFFFYILEEIEGGWGKIVGI